MADRNPLRSSPDRCLSRDSPIDQRMEASLLVQGLHGCVDCAIESDVVGEGVVGEMVRLEIMPDDLDVVELGCVFRQPLDGKPVLARFKGLEVSLLTWIGPLSS